MSVLGQRDYFASGPLSDLSDSRSYGTVLPRPPGLSYSWPLGPTSVSFNKREMSSRMQRVFSNIIPNNSPVVTQDPSKTDEATKPSATVITPNLELGPAQDIVNRTPSPVSIQQEEALYEEKPRIKQIKKEHRLIDRIANFCIALFEKIREFFSFIWNTLWY